MDKEDTKCRLCGTIWLINEKTGICVTCEMEYLLDEDEPMYPPHLTEEDYSPEAFEED